MISLVIRRYHGKDTGVSRQHESGTRAHTNMDKDKYRGIGRKTDVLKRFNAETLMELKRGLMGELPEKLRPPPPVPVRGGHPNLVIVKPSGILSSCLPVIPDSPTSGRDTPSDDEGNVTLRKSFSFREKFSRLSRLGREKGKKDEKKWNTITEDDKDHEVKENKEKLYDKKQNRDYEHKTSKRFWWSRQKEIAERPKTQTPVYKRSKSFEFLPRAIEEDDEQVKHKKSLRNSNSYVFGSTDTMGEAWTSNDSLEYFTNSVYYDDDDDTVFIKDVKETKALNNNSSPSTSASSGLVLNIFKTDSVQNLLNEFDRTVEMFSENYLSDCETYCKTVTPLSKREKRKSSSFSTLQSPKVVQVSKINEISNDFKIELELLIARRGSDLKTPRRGSVTDWFVLEDQHSVVNDNRYNRAKKKSTKTVRRMSSTKYWITPEECAEYTREQRPPLVIPRITTYRTPRPRAQNSVICAEDSYLDSSPPSQHYERLQDSWGPVCDRGRGRDIRNLTKPNHNLIKLDKRLGNSTENLSNSRRPQHLQIPASSSGDSLDVEVRDRTLDYGRVRNCRSMVAPKSTRKSPLPTPRQMLPVEATVVLEGPMKRTKYTENSKKSKKNWTDCYVVLTTTALYFYKDQKTYNATKVPPGTPPSPNAARLEIVLPLLNAHIVQCIQQHTRRYARSLIFTVDHQQYLIQDETEQGAKKWLIAIGETIYKLGPPGIGEFHNSHTPQYQSSNTDLESLGRTPPVSRHANRNKTKAGGSSNEDLSELQEKTQVKSKLKKLLNKRPSKDILYKKGILRDEPVFGRNLEAVCPTTSPRVPPFVVACVKEIESSEENMCTDGLYRASGNLSQVQKIRLQVDQNNLNAIAENTDIHVLAGSLKLFFRELKEPLIPFNLFDRVLKACMIKPKEARIKEFREIVQALPQCNRDTLKYLLEHLLRVTEHSEHNRMHTTNLAIVFGPTLLWSPIEKPSDFAMDCIQQNNVVDILLNDFKEIFDSKKKS